MLLIKIFFICVFPLILSVNAFCADEPYISAESAVVINAHTLEVYYEKDAFSQRSMASTTKIMTALLACESNKGESIVVAENFAAEGTSIGLKEGDKLYFQDLVYAMMLASGNDAARLTASFLSGSEEKFAEMMNEKAREIGMNSTNFVTASGLDADGHYTTAYDMALLGAAAVKNDSLREIMSCESYTVKFLSPEKQVTFYNHNKLLSQCEGVFGIKTGFTQKSGRCLVTACERDGVTFIAVTLKAPDDWNDHQKLYDYVFGCVKNETIYVAPQLKAVAVCGGAQGSVSVEVDNDGISLPYKDTAKYELKVYLPHFLYAPISKGDVIGRVEISVAGNTVAERYIYVSEDVGATSTEEKFTILDFFRKIFDFGKE